MTRPGVSREQLASILQHDGAQDRALCERQPLPDRLEERFLLGEHTCERGVKVVERGPPASSVADVVPGLVREPLHVVRKVAGEIDNGRAKAGLGLDAALAEPRFDERGKDVGRDLLEPHDRTGLVEGPLGSDHLLHQARLRAGEDVTDAPLMLRGRPQRVLDAAAVEGVDGLELVERHDDGALPFGCQLARQREDLVREAIHVALAADHRERDRQAAGPGDSRLVSDLRTGRRDHRGEPVAGPLPPCLHARQCAGVAFEKRQVGAVTADRDLDRQRGAPGQRRQCLPHQRGLPVASRRDQEDLLPGRQVLDEPLQLVLPVDERLDRDDFTVDERVLHRLRQLA